MKSNLLTQSGSVLIEALVALVIVSVGTFGVVKLNTVMLSGTGLSKTRAEALQIALKRMEDVRDYALTSGCPAVGDSTEANPVAGVNASYVVGKSITSSATGAINVNVCVGWDGSSTPCAAAADKRIILKSIVSCVGVGTSGMIGGGATAATGGKVKTPTGAAHVGGNDYGKNLPAGRTLNYLGGGSSGTADGTSTYLNPAGAYELIDESTGKVLLTINDGSAFSTISGRAYITRTSSGGLDIMPGSYHGTNEAFVTENVFVLSSDASYCARVIPSTLSVDPSGKYAYFDYRCYVSKAWWGNIGVVRLDNPINSNRVCVGDPTVSSAETSIWSRKAALSIRRGYRAYRQLLNSNGAGTGVYETIGIGVSTSDGTTYTATTIPSSATEHHDFLLAVVGTNGTCGDTSISPPKSGPMTLTSPSTFVGDQGMYYCMSGQCPGLIQTVTTPSTLIHGTITKGTGAVLTDLNDTDCSSHNLTPSTDGSSYSYSCQLNWVGFAGSYWYGAISFQASGTTTLCASGSAPVVVPSGNSVPITVNNLSASPNPNSISFTDVPLAVTDVTFNFSAAAVTCNSLGQPAPAWGSGNTKGELIWTGITNATGYKIATCTSSSSTCSPSTLTTTTSLPTYPPQNPSIGQTTCVGITATDSTNAHADSVASSPKCVTATSSGNSQNASYTYN